MEATQMTTKEANQLNAAKATIKSFWDAACKVEGIDPASKFVVFSNDNLFAKDHNVAMDAYFKLVRRIKANIARRERHAAMKDLGLNRVKGNLGGVYYE
jgi:hypothetical protein